MFLTNITYHKFYRALLVIVVIVFCTLGQSSFAQNKEALLYPQISEIQPNPVVGSSERQWIRIIGNHFTFKSTVALYLGERVFSIPPERIKLISSTELAIYINVSTKPSLWRVQVNNGGRNATPFSFSVIAPNSESEESQSKLESKQIPEIAEVSEQDENALQKAEKKKEIELLDKKEKEIREEIEQAKAIIQESKKEAAQAATEKAITVQEVEKKSQIASAAKVQAETLHNIEKEALVDNGIKSRVQELIEKVRTFEQAAIDGTSRLIAVQAKEEAAKEKVAASESKIEKLNAELIQLKKIKADQLTLAEKLMNTLWIIVISFIIWLIKKIIVRRFESPEIEEEEIQEGSSRLRTLALFLSWFGTLLIIIVALYLILDTFGINMAPILASLGFLALSLSLGGQHLVRDILHGTVILIEGQYNINDVIRVEGIIADGFSGRVENINLRRTQLRDIRGSAIYIPNGDIRTVTNFTKNYGRIVVDIGVPFKENTDRVMEIMEEVMKEMRQGPKYEKLVKNFEMLGIESLKKEEIIIRCRFKTVAGKQWSVAREYRRRLKSRFDKFSIELS
ncbi:mechanosensitive ion channel domain-containing protein [Candidatus Nitrosacidococcus tergens]|uniref:MscS Mechanosensitive ion channel n=1 Tax=Candidatus Nitrosacidococcus tergens TaxID=553981 RepID=A0A7G1QBH5_9GAMM|nr:mechanosensitive ion channel domain-containing protein [Candidatus Nitrosacidococcus tergens]CAB1277407.1 MscS Mechanosensitive ion channel [Candidatus Nitrosacidococcus tergens]